MSQGTGPPVLSLRWFQSVGAFVILASSRLCSNPMVHHHLLTASKVLFSSDLDKPKGPEALQPGFPKSPVHEGTSRAQYPISPSINFGRHLWRNSLPPESPNKPSLLLRSSREHSDLKTRCAVLPADLPRESPGPSSVSVFQAGLASSENSEQLIIALEPEAASIYCRKLRLHQMIELSSKAVVNGYSASDTVGAGFAQGTSALSLPPSACPSPQPPSC